MWGGWGSTGNVPGWCLERECQHRAPHSLHPLELQPCLSMSVSNVHPLSQACCIRCPFIHSIFFLAGTHPAPPTEWPYTTGNLCPSSLFPASQRARARHKRRGGGTCWSVPARCKAAVPLCPWRGAMSFGGCCWGGAELLQKGGCSGDRSEPCSVSHPAAPGSGAASAKWMGIIPSLDPVRQPGQTRMQVAALLSGHGVVLQCHDTVATILAGTLSGSTDSNTSRVHEWSHSGDGPYSRCANGFSTNTPLP